MEHEYAIAILRDEKKSLLFQNRKAGTGKFFIRKNNKRIKELTVSIRALRNIKP